MSLPFASGALFAIFIITLHTIQVRRSITGLFRRLHCSRLCLQLQIHKCWRMASYEGPHRLEARRGESDCRMLLLTSALDPTMMK
jgi:hypothetical protein